MCVLALAWRAHPRWLLVAAGNRDEYHARASAPLDDWTDLPVVAGRDLVSGGAWMGVSRKGRFAVVTNVRGEAPALGRRSRGELVTAALTGASSGREPGDYGPYNLIAATTGQAVFSTNRPHAAAHPLGPGVYGLANAGLDEPWPKTVRLKAILAEWLAGAASEPAALLAGLAEEAPDPALSSIFIRNPLYGTRCSTVVAVAADGAGTIVERRFTPAGDPCGETRIAFRWRALRTGSRLSSASPSRPA